MHKDKEYENIDRAVSFLPVIVPAQVDLNLRLCREMALESSKEVSIADKQQQKAAYEVKMYKADYLPKVSAVGFGLYHQKSTIIN